MQRDNHAGRSFSHRQVTHGILQTECGGDGVRDGGGPQHGAGEEGGDGGEVRGGHGVVRHGGHHERVGHLQGGVL